MQINRLFELIYILLESKQVTAARLAEKFEVSTRTIYRDVEILSQAGIPIYMSKGKGGGISLLPDFVLNKAVLTEQERTDILANMKAFSALNLSGDNSVLQKLTVLFGKQNADWIEVDFTSWGYYESDANNFEMLKNAILQKHKISFAYASGKLENLSREVYPLKLLFKGAAWYLYGFCKLRDDYRYFKLRRISGLAMTDEHFEMEAPQQLINRQRIETAQYVKTKLKISAEMAFRVYDEISCYNLDECGNFICELYLPDLETICSYAASYGEHCTILSPAQAIDEMKLRLQSTLKNYL